MARDRPDFGNGGEVGNLLNHAIISQQQRIQEDTSLDVFRAMALQPEDFDANFDRHSDYENRSKETFKEFVGGKEYHCKVRRLSTTYLRGHLELAKTTMARKVGQIFYDIEYLSSLEVVECSASDIIGK
ncbi:hypothetical protein ACMFMG_000016 [Clarireedia jacksonii]